MLERRWKRRSAEVKIVLCGLFCNGGDNQATPLTWESTPTPSAFPPSVVQVVGQAAAEPDLALGRSRVTLRLPDRLAMAGIFGHIFRSRNAFVLSRSDRAFVEVVKGTPSACSQAIVAVRPDV
jgi:hypothetical protein